MDNETCLKPKPKNQTDYGEKFRAGTGRTYVT